MLDDKLRAQAPPAELRRAAEDCRDMLRAIIAEVERSASAPLS